jgi:hypothetical protein
MKVSPVPIKRMGFVGLSSVLVVSILVLSAQPECVNGAYAADTDLGQGVLGFLRSLETTMEKQTAWFYRFFGVNVDPAKINQVKNCDYNNPDTMHMCPPAYNPRAPHANPNL